MPFVISTDRPVLWAVGDPVLASGIMEPGGLTVTGLALFSAENENEFLLAVVGLAGDYNPLPAAGGWCEAGTIYGYAGGLVICPVAQSHGTRTRRYSRAVCGVPRGSG